MVSGVQADPTRKVVEGPAASTDKIAKTANRVFEDTADGIVILSSRSIAAAKGIEVSFKLSAAAGRHSHTSAPMQTCGWCSYDCRWNRGSERDGHSCGKSDGTLVQVVSCGWKAQPHFRTNADLWLVLIQ
jgi:hypothetical protein